MAGAIKKIAAALGIGAMMAPEDADALNIGQAAKTFSSAATKFSAVHDRGVRAEISDAGAKVLQENPINNAVYKLGDVLDHPELYAAYPEMKNVTVKFRQGMTNAGEEIKGQSYGGVKFGPEAGNKYFPGSIHVNPGKHEGPGDIKNTLLHEAQHEIQAIEGWKRGIGLRGGEDAYLKDMGEKEARDVTSRMWLTPEERLKTPHFINDTIPTPTAEPFRSRLPVTPPDTGNMTRATIKPAAVAAGVAATLYSPEAAAIQSKKNRAAEEALQDAPNPLEYIVPARWGGGLFNAGLDLVINQLVNKVFKK